MTVNNSTIDASGNGSGYLAIQSGNFSVLNSKLFANNTGDIPMTEKNGVDVLVRSELTIDDSNILSSASSTGNAGSIMVEADSLDLTNRGVIATNTFGQGDAGVVTITAETINLTDGGNVNASTSGEGNAGDVQVTANIVKLSNGGQILSSSSSSNGGSIDIRSTPNNDGIIYLHNARITTSVSGAKGGKGGKISILGFNYLVMNTGLIQANTQGQGQHAGTIDIKPATIIVGSNETLFSNEKTRGIKSPRQNSGINVIQSIAPDGIIGSTTFAQP